MTENEVSSLVGLDSVCVNRSPEARERDEAGLDVWIRIQIDLNPTPLARPFLQAAVAENTALAAAAVARRRQNEANAHHQMLEMVEDRDPGPSFHFSKATQALQAKA